MKSRSIVLEKDIIDGLQALGLEKGQKVILHTSLSSFGFVCGGPQIVIEALLHILGEEGTIMMPTQTWKNLDPVEGVHWEEPKEWWQRIRDNWPAYDKRITPTNTMGAVAEMFWHWPGAVRSDHPVRSFAALGPQAEYLMKEHDLCNIFGDPSPLSKLYELDGYVLLLGIGYDKNTSIHLADARAEYPRKHMVEQSCAMQVQGHRKWVTYQTLYVDGEDFNEIGAAFEKTGKVRTVMIGDAKVRFMKQRELVDFAITYIETHRK